MPRFWNYLVYLKNTLTISRYWVIVYVQIEAYLNTNVKLLVLVAFVMGDNLVKCHIGVSFTLLSKIIYSFHLFNISKTRQLLYQISPNHSTLVGPHSTEKRLIMWVLYMTLTRVQTSHWWLELLCHVCIVKHVPNREIGTCWVIWMI